MLLQHPEISVFNFKVPAYTANITILQEGTHVKKDDIFKITQELIEECLEISVEKTSAKKQQPVISTR